MSRVKLVAVAASAAILVSAAGATVASAGTIKKSSGAAIATPANISARVPGTSVLRTVGGNVTCTGASVANPSSFGLGVLTSTSVTTTFGQKGYISKPTDAALAQPGLIFGSSLTNPTSTSVSTSCPSTINACGATATAKIIYPSGGSPAGSIPLNVRDNAAGTGVDIQLATVTAQLSCASGITCTYTSGTSGVGGAVNLTAAYNDPNLVAVNQPFYRSAGPSTCPARADTGVVANGGFSATYNLYTGTSQTATDRLVVTNP